MSFHQESDVLPVAVIVAITAGVIALSAVLVVIAWRLAGPRALTAAPDHGGRDVPAMADNQYLTLFPATEGIDRLRAGQRSLEAYRWIDRPQRIARIPIDRAAELYLAGERAGETP